ncbi:Agamous-like MADS-box protein AGL82, partial [Mucuna pruriens]
MGRARITLKPISNERSRKTTFQQRKKGLIKKISEFSTMCGVEACFIVYDDVNGDAGRVTWPQDPTMVRSIIENYERQKNERPPKTFDIQDFFENRKNMIEAEISKLHKQAREIKYPTWDPAFSNMGEEQLRAFIAKVDAKIDDCDQRINMLKNMDQTEANFSVMQNMAQASASSSHPSQDNFMQNISQSQIIPTPMEPLLIDNNGRVNFTNSTYQVGRPSSHGINMLRNMQQSDACFSYMPNMAREGSTSSHPIQLNCLQSNSQSQFKLETLKPLIQNNDMIDFTNQVYVPLDSTNQLGDLEQWVTRPIGIQNWSNQQGGDLVGLTSQPKESILQNIPVKSQNEQHGVVLPAFPSSLDKFQTDYYNMPDLAICLDEGLVNVSENRKYTRCVFNKKNEMGRSLP